jgi:hypothetical protein
MPTGDGERLRAIWRGQAVTALQMTPEQLRGRAAQFESAIRRRNLRDHVSFALTAAIFAYGILLDGAMVRVGSALVVIWALFSIYALQRFGSVVAAPMNSSAQTCASYHQRQLERQRDIALSWPWGIELAIPGFVLVVVGLAVGSRYLNWVFSGVMTGLFLFIYVAVVIYGKVLAGQWQREINVLLSLKDESS